MSEDGVRWCLSTEGIEFFLRAGTETKSLPLPLISISRERLQSLDDRLFRQLSLLEDLRLSEDLKKAESGAWCLDPSRLYEQDESTLRALSLPRPSPITGYLKSRNNPGSADYRLRLQLTHPEYGRLDGTYPRSGPLFDLGGGAFVLMPKRLFRLANLLESDAPPEETGVDSHIIFTARAKKLAEQAGVELEPWIRDEQYEFVQDIALDVEKVSDEELRLKPDLIGVSDEKFRRQFEASRGKRKLLMSPEGQKRKRLIISDEQAAAARELEDRDTTIRGEDVPRFIENPEAYVPQGLDLADFSKRVKGFKVRVYVHQPYVSIRKEKYNWFPEFNVESELTASTEDAEDAAGEGDGGSGNRPSPMTPDEYFELVKQAHRENKEYVRDRHGNWHRIPRSEIDRSLAAEDPYRRIQELERDYRDGKIDKIPKGIALDIILNLENLGYSVDRPDLEEEAPTPPGPEVKEFEVPGIFRGELRPYQELGYWWLRTLESRKGQFASFGGLLADDMGLGKTVQMIALLAALKDEDRVAPSIAVLPKTLMDNWKKEIHKFCPSLAVFELVGRMNPPPDFFEKFDLTLTTYDTLRRRQVLLAQVDWRVVFCDEAQYVKNPTTGRTTAVKALKSDSLRVALTGTPVENGLSEFWCIFDFVQPGLLGSRQDFRKSLERPIVRADSIEERKAAADPLFKKIRDYYLRRLKDEVAKELPPKTEHEITTTLSDFQAGLYVDILRGARGGKRGAMLAALQRLLALCADPYIDREETGAVSDEKLLADCPKLERTMEILEGIREKGEKAVIFLERKAVQRMLQRVIHNRFGVLAQVINGELLSGRQQVVDMFNESDGFNVLILGHRVGGVGLNITGANHVIHYMRPWNPAVENQATDRTHRIGQEKEVHIYCPIAMHPDFDTVEVVLDALLKDKRALARDILVPSAELKVGEKELMERVFGGGNHA